MGKLTNSFHTRRPACRQWVAFWNSHLSDRKGLQGRSFGSESRVPSSSHEPLACPSFLNCLCVYTCLSYYLHLRPHLCPHLFPGISQILRLVLQELNLFYSRDVNGVCLLYDLLHCPWLQALLKVSTLLLGILALGDEPMSPTVSLVSWQEISTAKMSPEGNPQRGAIQTFSLGRN